MPFGLMLCALSVLIGLADGAVRPFLPPWLQMQLLPLVFVLLAFVARRRWAYAAAFLGGCAADLFAFGAMDASGFRALLVVAVVAYAAEHWLTNRSLVASLALVLFGHGLYAGTGWAVNAVSVAAGWNPYPWPLDASVLAAMGWDAALTVSAFLFSVTIGRRFLKLQSRRDSRYGLPS